MKKKFSLEKEDILDNQIKEFCEKYNTKYSYDHIKKIEDYLNINLVNSEISSVQKIKIGNELISEIQIPGPSEFGHYIEQHIYNILNKAKFYLNIDKGFKERNPNGKMQFPDYEFDDGLWFDSKTVLCKPLVKKDNYSKRYNSGIGDLDVITKDVKDFSDNGTLNQKTSSMIILTYYSYDKYTGIIIHKIKIVPYLFYIACYKNESGFAIKRNTGTLSMNTCVDGRLSIKEGSCEVYLDKLRRTIKNIISTNLKTYIW